MVNLENDCIAKYVERLLNCQPKTTITTDFLTKMDFSEKFIQIDLF